MIGLYELVERMECEQLLFLLIVIIEGQVVVLIYQECRGHFY